MGLRYRDLVTELAVECMPGGPPPGGCGCTQTGIAPQCAQSSRKPPGKPGNPNCPRASAKGQPPKRELGGLEALRRQLRSELTTSG